MGDASFCYDANGNLTADGASAYLYDVENRLVERRARESLSSCPSWTSGYTGALQASLRYDPMGRLYELTSSNGAVTRLLYDGDMLVGEYNSAGNLLRRYVHGADMAADDPIAWFEGSGFTDADERLLRSDWQGSIVAVGNNTSSAIYAVNSYDEYGAPAATNLGRFQYTGQIWLPELGLYYYKARIYSPTLGRFLQTDPIGYKDQMNLYTYVQNDPLNLTDFSGNCAEDACIVEGTAAGATYAILSGVVAAGYCVKTCGSIVHNIEKIAAQIFRHDSSNENDEAKNNGQSEGQKDKPTVVPGKAPFKGKPGSTVQGRDKGRKYGPDGYPETDREEGHPDEKGPGNSNHSHDWGRPSDGGPPTHQDRGPPRAPEQSDPPRPHCGDPTKCVQ